MGEVDQQEILRAIEYAAVRAAQETAKAIIEAMPKGGCPTECKEKCGLTQPEHAIAHEKINEFFSDLADMTRQARSVIVKAIMGLVIGAAAIGLGINLEKFFR